MGDLGKISRIMAPLLGAHFTFATLGQDAATAPGQLTAAELFRILEILSGSVSESRNKSSDFAEGKPDKTEGSEQ
jgi:3-dehydroquinate dehydratase-1